MFCIGLYTSQPLLIDVWVRIAPSTSRWIVSKREMSLILYSTLPTMHNTDVTLSNADWGQVPCWSQTVPATQRELRGGQVRDGKHFDLLRAISK